MYQRGASSNDPSRHPAKAIGLKPLSSFQIRILPYSFETEEFRQKFLTNSANETQRRVHVCTHIVPHTHTRAYTYEIYKRNGVDVSTWNRGANPSGDRCQGIEKLRWLASKSSGGGGCECHVTGRDSGEKEKQWELEREGAPQETSKNSHSNRGRRTFALIFIPCAPLASGNAYGVSFSFRASTSSPVKIAFNARGEIRDSFVSFALIAPRVWFRPVAT